MKDFRNLSVWAKGHALTLAVYEETKCFPQDELYGLRSQLRRAAASIPANLAEGCGRDGDAELARFCQIAMGSASELEYHVLLTHDLGYFSDAASDRLHNSVVEVKRMLASLIRKLRADR